MKQLVIVMVTTFAFTAPRPALASPIFVGYELGEMSLNRFQNFAGEIGYTLKNDQAVRLVYMNVALTERHLSSDEALAVDGDNVEGSWRGFELHYDFPITKQLSFSPSLGYFDSKYRHIILNETTRRRSPTVGFAFSYEETTYLAPSDYIGDYR